jgi:hypothetical protein
MKITKEMSDRAFQMVNEVYGYNLGQKDLTNVYVRSWFAKAIEKEYGIQMPEIPTFDEINEMMIDVRCKFEGNMSASFEFSDWIKEEVKEKKPRIKITGYITDYDTDSRGNIINIRDFEVDSGGITF